MRTRKRLSSVSRTNQPNTLSQDGVLPKPKLRLALMGMDKPLMYVTCALSVLGLMAVFSASATEAQAQYGHSVYFLQRQIFAFIVGFAALWTVARIPYFYWHRLAKPIAFGVIGLLVFTMFTGVAAYGAERWIRIGSFSLQPSELAKISTVLLWAQAFGRGNTSYVKPTVALNFLIVMGTIFLVYEQPSLSMTIILAMTTAGMLLISGLSPFLIGGVGFVGATAAIIKLMNTEYQLRRIQGWLNPWADPQDKGYNLIQSLYAIGSGGLFGRGLGMSHQKLFYLPFQYTDFIFAVWAEEWGLLGSLVLVGLFITLLYRGFVIAKTCQNTFGQLLAMGIVLVLSIQIIINLFVATGLFPVTGVTLPLISYGGTSVIVTLSMIGMLLNISRYRATELAQNSD